MTGNGCTSASINQLKLPSEATPWSKLCAEIIFASFRSKRSRFSVYVDISDPEEECSTLAFEFKDAEITREWNITILQIQCDFENRAPPGCLQYFFGLNEDGVGGVIKSFNFDGGYHLGVFHVYHFKFLESRLFCVCSKFWEINVRVTILSQLSNWKFPSTDGSRLPSPGLLLGIYLGPGSRVQVQVPEYREIGSISVTHTVR
jgi:hypothetical protein